jgi:hypothetical protein
VVGPVEGHICCVLEDVVIGMSHDCDVSMSWGSLGAEGLKCVFRVRGIAGKSGLVEKSG